MLGILSILKGLLDDGSLVRLLNTSPLGRLLPTASAWKMKCNGARVTILASKR